MAIQFTDVPVDGLVPLICKIVVCIDWIAPTHKVVTEVKSIDVKTIAITATIFRNLLALKLLCNGAGVIFKRPCHSCITSIFDKGIVKPKCPRNVTAAKKFH